MDKYIVLDLETTGYSSSKDEIIEIGAWKVESGVVIDKFETFVKPHQYIPTAIQTLTGISMSDIEKAETMESVLPEFYDWCEDYNFIGYNLPFDFGFLLSKGKVLGIDFSRGGTRLGLDILSLCKRNLKVSNYKLETVVDFLGIEVGIASFHRASYDAYMTKMVYDRLGIHFPCMVSVATPSRLVEPNKYGSVACDDTLDFE